MASLKEIKAKGKPSSDSTGLDFKSIARPDISAAMADLREAQREQERLNQKRERERYRGCCACGC